MRDLCTYLRHTALASTESAHMQVTMIHVDILILSSSSIILPPIHLLLRLLFEVSTSIISSLSSLSRLLLSIRSCLLSIALSLIDMAVAVSTRRLLLGCFKGSLWKLEFSVSVPTVASNSCAIPLKIPVLTLWSLFSH